MLSDSAEVWLQAQLVYKLMDLLQQLKEYELFGAIQMIRFEREVIYRSNFLHTLYSYV